MKIRSSWKQKTRRIDTQKNGIYIHRTKNQFFLQRIKLLLFLRETRGAFVVPRRFRFSCFFLLRSLFFVNWNSVSSIRFSFLARMFIFHWFYFTLVFFSSSSSRFCLAEKFSEKTQNRITKRYTDGLHYTRTMEWYRNRWFFLLYFAVSTHRLLLSQNMLHIIHKYIFGTLERRWSF